MSINTPPPPTMPGDFATGERTDSATQEEIREESLHGDFAAGERTEPLPIDGETPGTFGDTGGQERPSLDPPRRRRLFHAGVTRARSKRPCPGLWSRNVRVVSQLRIGDVRVQS